MESSGRERCAMLEKLMPRKRNGTSLSCKSKSHMTGRFTRSDPVCIYSRSLGRRIGSRTLQLSKTTAVPG